MAWETRKRGKQYYTRSVRTHGRVQRLYFGTGLFAEGIAALDALQRAERAAWLQEQANVDQIETMMEALDGLCDDLVQVTLEEAGYHKHRSQWRRHRARREFAG